MIEALGRKRKLLAFDEINRKKMIAAGYDLTVTEWEVGMEIDGKSAKRFRIFRANAQGDPVGDVVAEYDNEVQVLAHERHADWHYLIYERNKPVTRAELKIRIWTCPICKQIVIRREASNPILPIAYRETCKLADYMIGVECVAFRDLKTALRLLTNTE